MKEKVSGPALQETQNAETEMKMGDSDQSMQGTQSNQSEPLTTQNPSPNTHFDNVPAPHNVPAPQNQQPILMNVTAPPGSQPGQVIHVQTPRGIFQVTIPAGIYGGMIFRIQIS